MRRSAWLLAAAVLLYVAALAVGDPHSTSWPLQCPLYWLTGWQCPLCGAQRAVHEAFAGRLSAAWSLNPGFWLLLPFVAAWTAASLSARIAAWRVVRWLCRDVVVFSVAGAMLAWGVLRNVC